MKAGTKIMRVAVQPVLLPVPETIPEQGPSNDEALVRRVVGTKIFLAFKTPGGFWMDLAPMSAPAALAVTPATGTLPTSLGMFRVAGLLPPLPYPGPCSGGLVETGGRQPPDPGQQVALQI